MVLRFSFVLEKHLEQQLHSHVIQEIASVPEIGVEGNDLQFRVRRVIDAVSSIVHTGLVGGGGADPVVLLPKCRNMVPIPRPIKSKSAQIELAFVGALDSLLLTKVARHCVWRVNAV